MSVADLPALVIIGDGSTSLYGDGIAPWGCGFSRIEERNVSTNASCEEVISVIPVRAETGVVLSVDCSVQCDAWFGNSIELDLMALLQTEAERYAALASVIHERHARLAVWGAIPPCSTKPGHEQERGVALLIFMKLLAENLFLLKIPFRSLEGDGTRLTAAMRLHALRLLAQALRDEHAVQETFERLVASYESSEYITEGGWPRLHLTFSGEEKFITHLFVRKAALLRIGYMSVDCVVPSADRKKFGWHFSDAQDHDHHLYRLPVGAYAKTLIVNAALGVVELDEITVFARMENIGKVPIGRACAA
jgi:hypothetical protein